MQGLIRRWRRPYASGMPGANFHTVYMHAEILCIECKDCNRRAALTKEDGLPIFQGNMQELNRTAFRCRCGSRSVRLYIPRTKDQATMFKTGDPLPDHCRVTAKGES